MRNVRSVAAAVCGLFVASEALAATAQSSFQVKMTIQDACTITATNDVQFGTQGVLNANVDASAVLSVQCTSGTAYNIGLDAGAGSGASVSSRKMTGPGSATVGYSLYRDSNRSQVWGVTIGGDTHASTGTGAAQNFTVYGRVPAQTTPAAGTYTDTINLTVTY